MPDTPSATSDSDDLDHATVNVFSGLDDELAMTLSGISTRRMKVIVASMVVVAIGLRIAMHYAVLSLTK